MKAVEIRDFWWRYPSRREWTLKGIDLNVQEREILGIIGPSSAGKTTLCLCISGVAFRITRGEHKGVLKVFGLEVPSTSITELSQHVSLVLQDPDVQFVTMRVFDEVAFALENSGLPRDEILERVREALEFTGMMEYANKPPHELSGGQKQRVALAAAIARRPSLLIVDEATSDLDPVGKREVFEVVERLRDAYRLTAIIVDHNSDDLTKFADRIIVLNEGKVAREGDPRSVFSKVEELTPFGIRIPQVAMLLAKAGFVDGAIPLTVDEALKVLRPLEHRIAVSESLDNGAEVRLPSAQFVDTWYEYEDGTIAIRGLNLKIMEGDFMAVVGPNGSGKTTMAKLLTGLLKPSRGIVLVEGLDTRNTSPSKLATIVGYVFQNPDHQLVCDTVREEVSLPLKFLRLNSEEIEKRVEWVLEAVGLKGLEDEAPYFLSKGERQRLALATVLVVKPRLLIVDEPTTGQDERGSRRVMDVLTELNKTGVTVVIITHDMRLVCEYAKRVAVLNRGQLIAEGPPKTVFSKHLDDLDKIGLDAPPLAKLMSKLAGRPAFTLNEVIIHR
ncbi:MAG: energy-coupling factor transporter ATPase [Thermofilaceae archaeon]|nr:energy-coupling factor transporter ATPase [Thermofilaceae archaeon]